MHRIGEALQLSAGDLVGHLNCRHLTELDLKVAHGQLAKPKIWDPVLETLAERGALHEQGFIEHLKAGGAVVTAIDGVGIDAAAVAATTEAMRRGDTVIVQGALQSGQWGGRADVLRRVETPSNLGGWSYEVTDTKLARETKGNTVLQISLYSDLVSSMQGSAAASAFVVTPGTQYEPEPYRIADYAAYYRHVRSSLERAIASPTEGSYPEPIEHCDICRWRNHCDERRRADDHLSLVAGISKSQAGELKRRGVSTMAALAAIPLPLPWRPDRGAAQSYEKMREQARIQVDGRTQGAVIYEALPQIPGFGLSRLPDDADERSPEQQARWLLASMLDFHGRENKAVWWEYFRLRDLSAEDLLFERDGLAGLEFVAQVGGTAKAPVHRYRFALQDTDIRPGDELHSLGGEKFGRAVDLARDQRTIDIKKRGNTIDLHPEAVFSHSFVKTQVLAESVMRIGEYVADHGMVGEGDYRAARDLLMTIAPRLLGQAFEQKGEAPKDAALRVALHLDQSVFPVQGPPGAGKTHTGARMICALAKDRQTVGVTANSHAVIAKLLDEAVIAVGKDGHVVRCMQKLTDKEPDRPGVTITTGNPEFLSALQGAFQLGGATSWFWARPDAKGAVDVLFIDEAAQMSLANVLAVSQAANSLVLLGDPRQLEQPIQGSHPDGVAVSALDHLLGTHATVQPDRGLFLPETWRLHPSICAFNSELFYEGRLHSLPGLEKQEIRSKGRLKGAGLLYSPVEHTGNQSSSPEEVEYVCALVDEILKSDTRWIDRDGVEAPVALKDILIIAPYNAQVFALQERLPAAFIGTVDKFQGQEAPIVIYSMTTSSYADAPRGMEFLYSANRLNVAISRAKCICVVVASPTLFEAECRTPRQMQLANAFCRYLETASAI